MLTSRFCSLCLRSKIGFLTPERIIAATGSVQIDFSNTSRQTAADTTLNRKDYGLMWNKALEAGGLVGEEVTIEIKAEAIKQ